MEFRDYATALRRHWAIWVGVTLAGLLAAVAVVLIAPPTYRATAQVFVASSGDGTSGAQFVNQRVTSYPDIADSRTVLGPVIDELGLHESFPGLQARVSATNPPGTSQIDIAVTDDDATRAASVANAVAQRFRTAVEELESSGRNTSPVRLTVTNPATVPASPVFPQPGLLLPLGLVVGIALGAAAAVVRSLRDTRVHDADDVRAAWGEGAGELVVLSEPPRRRKRTRATGRPATLLARRLEPVADQRPVRVIAVAPTPDGQPSARSFAHEVAAELTAWDVSAAVTEKPGPAGSHHPARVLLAVASPLASLREWRRMAEEHDGVTIVVPPGRVDRAELSELRSILTAAGARVLAVAVARGGRTSRTTARNGAGTDAPVPPSAAAGPHRAGAEAVPAGRR